MKKQVIADKGGGGYRPLRTSTYYNNKTTLLPKNNRIREWHLSSLTFLVVHVSLHKFRLQKKNIAKREIETESKHLAGGGVQTTFLDVHKEGGCSR